MGNAFVEFKTWQGGTGTGEDIEGLGPSLGQCRKKGALERTGPVYQPVPDGKQIGTVTYYNAERGFGKINRDVFFHVRNVIDRNAPYFDRGVTVAYAEGIDRDGRPKAVDVQLVNGDE